MDGVIRYSTVDDIEDIDKLIIESFGRRYTHSVLDNIDGRYLLYEVNGEIVAITGLQEKNEYIDGLDVDWTCTSNAYRKMGIMHKLFEKLLEGIDKRVYCSCWRIGHNEHPNLISLMNDYGFKCALKPKVTFDSRYNCPVNDCSFRKDICFCYEDLYVRESCNY